MQQTVAHIPAGTLLLQQVLIDPGLSVFVGHASISYHGRENHAGSHAIDSDAFWAVLSCHSPCHLDDSPLGRGIQEAGVPSEYCILSVWTLQTRPVMSGDSRPLTEDKFTMEPLPFLRISGIACRAMNIILVRLTRMSLSHADRSSVVASPKAPPTPTALLYQLDEIAKPPVLEL